MDQEKTVRDERVLLDTTSSLSLSVRAEQFAEFDLNLSHSLDRLESKWASYSTPNALRQSMRSLLKQRG